LTKQKYYGIVILDKMVGIVLRRMLHPKMITIWRIDKHTVQAYLERLPTHKLEQFLQQCKKSDQEEHYDYILPAVYAMLEQRKKGQSKGNGIDSSEGTP